MSTPMINRPGRKFLTLAALVAVGLVSSGCTRFRAHQGYVGDSVLLQSVSPGVDNKDSVQATLGRPTFTSQFGQEDWYYYARDTRQLAFRRPKPTGQFILHIKFDERGNVASVQQTAMENIVKLSPEGDKTPTLGRDRSFFEQIFGNIGTVGAPGVGGGGGQP